MTQQEAMNNIMQNWVRTKRNLAVVKQQMASGSITQHSMEFDINQTEQILKSHGFVYFFEQNGPFLGTSTSL